MGRGQLLGMGQSPESHTDSYFHLCLWKEPHFVVCVDCPILPFWDGSAYWGLLHALLLGQPLLPVFTDMSLPL